MTAIERVKDSNSVDFFISYTGANVDWAKWVAWELSRAGYKYRMQAEHFVPGTRFVNEMKVGLQNAQRVLAIFSPNYFESRFASIELQSAVAEDPLGETRRVVPVLVEKCNKIPALFKDLVYIDFVGKSEIEQRRALIAGVRAAMLGTTAHQSVRTRPDWPGSQGPASPAAKLVPAEDSPLRVQFIACDVGRGLDLRGQYKRIEAALKASHLCERFSLRGEFDTTDSNLFQKLNSYRPNVVHISGNQNGGDVLLPSSEGGEVIVADEVLAGLLSCLGEKLQLAIIDTCKSYRCAKRVSEVVGFAIGVDDDIYDDEATRFYEVLYQAVGAGLSLADAYGQASTALKFLRVPQRRIPKLCTKTGRKASDFFLAH